MAASVSDRRLTTTEVAEFFAAAAKDADTMLLTALGPVLPVYYLEPPKLQLVLATGPVGRERQLEPMQDCIDFAPLGRCTDRKIVELCCSTTATPTADVAAAGTITRAALVRAAGRIGFIDATEQCFRPGPH